jgi:tetratricopeptide (TPR) repeat protein
MQSPVHVLFVHGLFSGPDTWSDFTDLIRRDPDLDFVQTHTMRYFTPKVRLRPDRRIPDFADLAAQLATRLKAEDLREARSVVVVAHSQGGLVVQKFLASATSRGQARELARIRQIVLYACPTLGSPFFGKTRRWVFWSRHPQERHLRLLDGEVFEAHQLVLRNVVNADNVTDYTCPIPVTAVVGSEDNIVPRIEATGWFPTTETVAADHFSILKAASPGAMPYQILKAVLPRAADSERPGPAAGTGRVPDAEQQQAIQFSLVPPAGLGRLRGRNALINTLMAPGRNRVHVLSGMSGIGKTHIAAEVAARRKEEGWNVWWVSVSQLASRMREVAHQLGLPPGEIGEAWRGERSQTDLVWHGLADHGRPWLLVFDGVTDPAELGRVAPETGRCDGTGWVREPTSMNGAVLVTSRGGHNDVWGPWCRIHQVEPLNEYDGADVLMDIAGSEGGGVEQARQLSRALGGLPLALRAAASRVKSVATGAVFLSEPGLSDFAGYLAEWRSREDAGNGDAAAGGGGEEVLGLSIVRESLLLSAKDLSIAATRLLHLFACLSDAPVPYRVLARPEMLTETPLFAGVSLAQMRVAIGQLAEAHLIRKLERGADDPDLSEFLSLHPMVHNVFREDDQVLAHRVDYSRAMLDILAAATENRLPDDSDNWDLWAALFPHARDAVLSTVASAATNGERLLVVSALNLARNTARYLLASGLLEQAGALLDALIDECESYRFEATDTKILALRHERARLWIELGRYDRAADELEDVIAGQTGAHGPDHANTWASRHQLARALLEEKQWAEAERMLREILPAERRINGRRHRETVTVWHTWARALLHVEGARQAETMCREILAVCEQLWNPSYPETLYVWQTLGRSLLYQQKPDLAEWELRRGLSRVADTASPGALGIRHFIGMAVLDCGRVSEAREELRALLADENRVLGPEHRRTGRTRSLLARIAEDRRGAV